LNRKQGRKSRPVTACNFGNKNFTIGDEWNPHLEPDGINYCITCRCKKDGLVDCEETKCKPITCPGKLMPSGKCCAVCPNPENGVSLSKKQCRYNGKSYQQGEVWNIPMEKEIGDNNCAECTCH
ncbi:chordin 2, partial [Paramuricea clavata]